MRILASFFLSLVSLLPFLSPVSHALSISVIPGINDIGYAKRGDTYLIDFYVLSDSSSEITVSLDYAPPHFSVYTSPAIPGFNTSLASQEDISSWIKFEKKYVIIPPGRKYYPESNLWANERVGLILEVPKDAEPGIHIGSITITPLLQSTMTRGAAIQVISIVKPVFVFRVPGEVVRSGYVLGFSSKRIDEDSANVKVYFKNNGTVSYSARVDYLQIKNGSRVIASFSSPYLLVKPFNREKEQSGISTFSFKWRGLSSLPPGDYDVEVKVSWITGSTIARGKITLEPYAPAEVQLRSEAKPRPGVAGRELLLIFVVFIILLSVVKLYGSKKEYYGFRKKNR